MNRWIKRQRGWRLFTALWLWFVLSYAVAMALADLAVHVIGPVHAFHMPYWVPPFFIACSGLLAAVLYRRFSRERAGPDTSHDHAGH